MSEASANATLTLYSFDASPERPHLYDVHNPTRADVENAANGDDYPRTFWGNGNMSAFLVYHKNYRPEAMFHMVKPRTAFVGNRNPKYRNPAPNWADIDAGLQAFRHWWSEMPNTIPERKYLFGQLRDVLAALSIGDIPLALGLLEDLNLAVAENTFAVNVKQRLVKALNDAMFPRMWDWMDPETRPPMPYAFPEPTNSGTNSGTQSGTSSQTIAGSGTRPAVSITASGGATA